MSSVTIRNPANTLDLGDSTNPLRVDPTGATTQPVSGTVTANQGGTWTVQPGNTANTTAWLTAHGKTIKSAVISAALLGDNTIISAVSGKRLKIVAFHLQAVSNGQTVTFKDGASTDLSGALPLNAREYITIAVPCPSFLLGTTAGNAFIISLGAATSIVGFVTYFDDDAT